MSEVAKPVRFTGADGTPRSGRLHLPAGRPRAWALFAHCFACVEDLRPALRIAECIAERGIGVLRFDFTGLGAGDEEDAQDAAPACNVDDLVAAADFLADNQEAPQVLVGHSLGGAAAIAAAHRLQVRSGAVRAVATLGAPAGSAHIARLLRAEREEVEQVGEGEVELEGKPFWIKAELLRDLERPSLVDTLPAMRTAFLFCHAPRDAVVPVEHARLLFDAAKHPKSFLSLDESDHLLSRPDDAAYAGTVIGAWASRYVQPSAQADAEERVENQVVVRGGAEGLAQDIRAGHHRLRADEPVAYGGQDTGPGPYDLLLAALGSCSAMTVKLYAARKGWPVEAVTVTLDHERRHVDDCRECEDEPPRKLDHIDKGVTIEGELSTDQLDRLVEISDRCPVHRTLQSEIRIATRRLDRG
jgi:uncharacterized OsmC-like protein/pimeloyl-ACP methyl ester carboxylesterase